MSEEPSLTTSDDGSRVGRTCPWCGKAVVGLQQRRDAIYCSKRCRQAAHRLAKRSALIQDQHGPVAPAAFAYADPPYLYCCSIYGHFHPDGRCWDDVETHARLIAGLEARRQSGELMGYAISCSKKSLRALLPLCPEDADPCPWGHVGGVPRDHPGRYTRSEFVIYVGGRRRPPGVRDFLTCHPARGEGSLLGRKPSAFCAWLFDCLGMVPGDALDDLFPGTGIVSRAWHTLSERCRVAAVSDGSRIMYQSLVDEHDASPVDERDAGAMPMELAVAATGTCTCEDPEDMDEEPCRTCSAREQLAYASRGDLPRRVA